MKQVYLLWALLLIPKLLISAWLPLSNDESYYWVWSHNLQWSYFDHPPIVAWLYWLGQPLESLFQAVRWPGVIVGHLSTLIWLFIGQRFLSANQLIWLLALLVLNPLTGPGSLIITPDIPMLFFWSLSTWVFLRLLERPSFENYLLLGLSLGLGFSSKYPIVIFFPIAFLYLVVNKKWKLFHPGKVLALTATFVIGSLPVWWWNLNNDWASFSFQLNHGLGGSSWTPEWTYKYVLGQLALIFPVIVYFAWQKNPQTISWLKWWAWGPVIFFFITSFKGHVEANWPLAAYPAMMALAVASAGNRRLGFRFTTAFWSLAFALVLSLVINPWLPIDPNKLKTKEFHQYDPYAKALAENNYFPAYASSFQMASKISYLLKRSVPKIKGIRRVDFYDFKENSAPQAEVYYLINDVSFWLPKWASERGDKVIESIPLNDTHAIHKVMKGSAESQVESQVESP